MKKYTIELKSSIPSKELFLLRKNNLKHTSMLWITTGWEFDPDMIGGIYYKKTALLIWLN